MTENLHDVIIGFQAETIQMERKLLKATKDVDKAAKSFERGGDAGQKMFDRIERSMSPTLSKMRDVRKELDRMEKDFGDAALGMEKYQQGLRIIDNLQMKAEKSGSQLAALMSTRGLHGPRAMGTAIQQAGYQVGDFAVQVASGQSAMTAFIQQGTQLVSMFGPTGAVIGAVGAIGGAIYTAFAAASDAAEDATEDAITYAEKLTEVKEAIEALRETTLTAAIEGQGKERTDAVEQARAAFIEQEIILNRLLNTAKGDSAVLNSQLVKGQQKLVEDARTLWKLAEAQKRALEGVKGQAEKREREAELEKQNAEITLKLGIQKAKMISERKKAERDAEKKANEERVKEQEKLLKTLQKNEEKFDEWRKQRAETNVEETRKRGEEAAAQLKKTLKDQQKAYEESMKPIKEFNEKIFGAMEDKLVDFVTTGKMSFKGMADSIIADIARIVIQRQITGPLAAIGESMLTSFASSIKFFADGGSVSGPGGPRTDDIPAMLSNGEFVVNARAAQKNRGFLEAINSGMVPQRFADGGPVSSANTQMMKQGGGGDTVVNIIDQRSGDKAPVETQETRGSNGRRQIAVMIRDTVRRGISSGEYDGALNGRFGSQPATIRRG